MNFKKNSLKYYCSSLFLDILYPPSQARRVETRKRSLATAPVAYTQNASLTLNHRGTACLDLLLLVPTLQYG